MNAATVLSTSPQLGGVPFSAGAQISNGEIAARTTASARRQGRQRDMMYGQCHNRGVPPCAPSVALNLVSPQQAPQSHLTADPLQWQECRNIVLPGTYISSGYAAVNPPWLVQNTFVSTPMERSPSLDGFYEERMVRSTPPSPPPSGQLERAGPTVSVPAGESQFMIPTPTGSEAGTMLLPPPGKEVGLNTHELPVLRLSDVLGDASQGKTFGEVGSNVDAWSTTDSTAAESIPSQSYAGALGARFRAVDGTLSCGASSAGSAEIPGMTHSYQAAESTRTDGKPELGSAELPSRGSTLHRWGVCKPCAFVFQACNNGVDCQFCHLCEPGERKRRKKERLAIKREARTQLRQQQWEHNRLGTQRRLVH